MARYQPISFEAHASLMWRRFSSYSFARNDLVAGLLLPEVPQAVLSMPLGFVAQGDTFTLVGLQGLMADQNLFVDANGRWLGGYVPAAYRAYPFALASTESGDTVLCIDQDSGLVHESGDEPFFAADKQPSPAISSVLGFLQQVNLAREATARSCASLVEHGLVEPWPIQLQIDASAVPVQGLHRINESALAALPAQALQDLRDSGGLMLAYAQRISMNQLNTLARLAQAHIQQQAQASVPQQGGELNLDFLNSGETLKFS
jgi:hypothetical protein